MPVVVFLAGAVLDNARDIAVINGTPVFYKDKTRPHWPRFSLVGQKATSLGSDRQNRAGIDRKAQGNRNNGHCQPDGKH